MKSFLVIGLLLLASCGKDIIIQRVEIPAPILDSRLQCQVFDLTGIAGVPVFKDLQALGILPVSRIDSISNGTTSPFKPFENTEYAYLVENFAINCDGIFEAKESGTYIFAINSDDGSTLTLGDTKLIDNNTDHGMIKKSISVLLMKGSYKFNTTYYNHSGSKGFVLSYKRPNASLEEVLKF